MRSRIRVVRAVSLCVLITTLTVGLAFGQEATGRIVGNVTDQTGAAVVGAKVIITNLGTRITRSTVSDKGGFYEVLSLPIGAYKVTIEMPGFRKQAFENQALQINQSLRLDARLEVGQSTEVVEVSGQAANVETENQTVGVSIVGETIQRAPLNGRDVLDLAKLVPGVTETNDDSGAAGSYSIAGGRSDSITFLLDGALNNDLLSNGVVFNPNPDTIAEFRILESNYSAEYGRNGGGVISVVTKSGTNQWHGSAFEFLRNDAFNANTFINNAESLPRDVLKRNQYGATFGGPIKRERAFFFVGYQGQRLSEQQSSLLNTVYTPGQLMGDFSGGGSPGNCPNADPGVAAFLQTNPYFQANAASAACAIIDPTKFDPVAQNYISKGLIPTDPTGQHDYLGSHIDNQNELTMKFDFVATQKDKLSITLGGHKNPVLDPFNFATVPGYSDSSHYNSYFANAAYSRTITASLLSEFRLFVQRYQEQHDQPIGSFSSSTASSLGFGTTPDHPTGPPNLLFDNGLSIGYSEQGPTTFANTTFGFTEAITYIHGNHNWRLGTGISDYRNNTLYDFIVNGEWDFNSTGSGNSLADFLFGIPSAYFQYPEAPSNIRSKSYYGFVQDEWRLARNFTLNWGLRYEYNSPKLDTAGRSFSVTPSVKTPSQVFPNAPIGMLFPGDPNAPKGVNFPNRNNWGPRFGFAWDPSGDGKTSVRGGVGLFYDILKGEDNLQFNGQPPFFSSAGVGYSSVTPNNGPEPFFTQVFANALPGATGTPVNPFPSHKPPSNLDFNAAGFLPINAADSVYIVDPHLRTPYTYQYNLSLQREMARNLVVDLSYVGSTSHGLTSLQDINPFVLGTTDQILNLTPGNTSCVDDSGFSTNPNVTASSVCSYATLPEFKNVSEANYNSLQASLTRQIADTPYVGRTYFTLAYTYSHSIDNASGFRQRNSSVPTLQPGLFRAASDQDVRHRITFSGGWDMPWDKAWESGPKRLTQGWSLFPIVTWHTGFPYDVFARLGDRFTPGAEGPSGVGDPYNVHANIAGPLQTQNPRKLQDLGASVGDNPGFFWVDPTSFSNAQCADPSCVPGPTMLPSNEQVVNNPSLATYGTLPRNYLRGPGYINFDLALSKTTALIGDRTKLEFRAEFFNIFNHANFLNPDTNINSGQFGQVTSTHDPRIIQLALRLSF
jgi:hypothetical protein